MQGNHLDVINMGVHWGKRGSTKSRKVEALHSGLIHSSATWLKQPTLGLHQKVITELYLLDENGTTPHFPLLASSCGIHSHMYYIYTEGEKM